MALTHSVHRRRPVLNTATGIPCTGKSYGRHAHSLAQMASKKRKNAVKNSPSAPGNGKVMRQMTADDMTGTLYAHDRATERVPRQLNVKVHLTYSTE